MLPFILAGGAAASLFAYFKPRCSICKSLFTSNQKCFVCEKEVCGDCGSDIKGDVYFGWPILQKGRCCKTHDKDIEAKVASLKAEIDIARKVTTYSKNFKGKTESPKLSKVIETNFHADKDVAELELQMLAAKEGCLLVLNVEFLKDTQSSSNYTYAVWKAKGVI
jgi:hypothetical protein